MSGRMSVRMLGLLSPNRAYNSLIPAQNLLVKSNTCAILPLKLHKALVLKSKSRKHLMRCQTIKQEKCIERGAWRSCKHK